MQLVELHILVIAAALVIAKYRFESSHVGQMEIVSMQSVFQSSALKDILSSVSVGCLSSICSLFLCPFFDMTFLTVFASEPLLSQDPSRHEFLVVLYFLFTAT